jgi:hypothetical protein
METSAVKKPNPDDFKSNWEFTKVTSNYHFDPNIMDPRWDTIHGLGKFEGDWDNEVNTLIQDAKAISWRTRQFSANADYYTSPMVEQEEYDLKKANMDPDHPMFRIKNLTSFGPMLSKMVNLFCLEETKSKIHVQFPGELLNWHIDKLDTLKTVKKENLIRVMVVLKDWVPGHFYQYGNYTYSKWKKGDFHTFAWEHVPHCTANASLEPRPILNIIGGLTDKSREFLANAKEVAEIQL